jgi:hypothetical protein
MRTQNRVLVKVVGVSWLSADVIFGNKERVKAVLCLHYRIEILENFELFILDL